MSVIFSSLVAVTIPKLKSLLDGRPESYASGVTVANKVVPKKKRLVTVYQGAGVGDFDTLDDTTFRVNVYDTDEANAEDLALLVRALFTGPLRDGDPITYTRVNAGPIEVPNDTDLFQWYMVVDAIRRGSQFT